MFQHFQHDVTIIYDVTTDLVCFGAVLYLLLEEGEGGCQEGYYKLLLEGGGVISQL